MVVAEEYSIKIVQIWGVKRLLSKPNNETPIQVARKTFTLIRCIGVSIQRLLISVHNNNMMMICFISWCFLSINSILPSAVFPFYSKRHLSRIWMVFDVVHTFLELMRDIRAQNSNWIMTSKHIELVLLSIPLWNYGITLSSIYTSFNSI